MENAMEFFLHMCIHLSLIIQNHLQHFNLVIESYLVFGLQ